MQRQLNQQVPADDARLLEMAEQIRALKTQNAQLEEENDRLRRNRTMPHDFGVAVGELNLSIAKMLVHFSTVVNMILAMSPPQAPAGDPPAGDQQ
jgi:hypothetical protein